MEKVTREFYKKDIEYNKFFEKKKKISFDTSEEFLEIIDKLAELTKNSRTMILNALIGAGMAPCFQLWEKKWKEFLEGYEGNGKEEIKKNLKKFIEDLKKLKEEHHIEKIA